MSQPRVAVLIPCYNESVGISRVEADFKSSLPTARIYVYDNNSDDSTAKLAIEAGAIVRNEWQQGKGAVIRRMFRDIDFDFYIMVDGDHTYDAALAPRLMALALETRCDLVNAIRMDTADDACRAGHRLSNVMLTSAARKIFGDRARDMLSGYKVLSCRFVKSLKQAQYVWRRYPDTVVDLPVVQARATHGIFSMIGAVFVVGSIAFGIPLINEYLHTGLVPRFPTAILATGVMLLGMLSFVTGLILDTVTRGRREMKMLAT